MWFVDLIEAFLGLCDGWFALIAIGAAVWSQLSDKQRLQLISQVTNTIRAAIFGAAELLVDVEGQLHPIVIAFSKAIKSGAAPISAVLSNDFKGLTITAFNQLEKAVSTGRPSTPETAIATGGAAMAEAYAFGLTSFAITAAFEAAFPEKLNVLNGTAAMIASLAGFDAISESLRGPLLKEAFGVSADYYYRSIFKPDYPKESDAVRWHSRGRLTDAQLEEVFKYSGLKQQYEKPFIECAYRPISAFMLRAGFVDKDIPEKILRDAFVFMGYRKADVELGIEAVKTQALQQVRKAYVDEAVKAYSAGVVEESELDLIFNKAGWGKEARSLAVGQALMSRRVDLAKSAETQVVQLVVSGAMTSDDGYHQLIAAGVVDWKAELVITLAATRADVARARRAAAAERKLELERERNLIRAAVAEYQRGVIDEAGLTAALLAI